jgi:hypothetical protein
MIPRVLVLSLLSSCVLPAASVFGYRASTTSGYFMLHWMVALPALFLALLSNSMAVYSLQALVLERSLVEARDWK